MSRIVDLSDHLFSDITVSHRGGYFQIMSTKWAAPYDLRDDIGIKITQPDGRNFEIGADALKHFVTEHGKMNGSALQMGRLKNQLQRDKTAVYDIQKHKSDGYGWIDDKDFVAIGSAGNDDIGLVLKRHEAIKGTFYGHGGKDKLKFVGLEKNYRVEVIQHETAQSEKHQKITYIGSDSYKAEIDVYGDVELAFVAPLKYVTHTGNLIDYWPGA